MLKNIKSYLYLTAIIAVAALLILNEFLLYGLIVSGTGFLAFALWQQIIKSKDEKINELRKELKKNNDSLSAVKEEVEELRTRRLKFTDIKSILDLGLMEVNTNFTRTWNKQFSHNKQEVHFIGALRVNIIAKFGIDMQQLKFKYLPENNELVVANADPKFLSFTDLDYIWEISEILEYKKPFVGANHWKKTKKLQNLGHSIKEDLQNRIHQEVKNGPEELHWLLKPLRKQIANTLDILLGGGNKKITLTEEYDENFVSASELPDELLKADKKKAAQIAKTK